MSRPVIAGRIGAPPAPAELSEGARAVWARLAPELVQAGILEPSDYSAFGCLCELEAEVERRLAAGRFPLALMAELRRWHEEFLMSPAARAKAARYRSGGAA